MTYTYAELPVSAAAYDEIAVLLRGAGYDHAFHKHGDRVLIDMRGIGLSRNDVAGTSGAMEAPWT